LQIINPGVHFISPDARLPHALALQCQHTHLETSLRSGPHQETVVLEAKRTVPWLSLWIYTVWSKTTWRKAKRSPNGPKKRTRKSDVKKGKGNAAQTRRDEVPDSCSIWYPFFSNYAEQIRKVCYHQSSTNRPLLYPLLLTYQTVMVVMPTAIVEIDLMSHRTFV